MPDASHSPFDDDRMRHDADQAWRDAFARLPQESPDRPMWSAISQRLDARSLPGADTATSAERTIDSARARAPFRWLPLALAASVSAVVMLPAWWWLHRDGDVRSDSGRSPFAVAPTPPPAPTVATTDARDTSPAVTTIGDSGSQSIATTPTRTDRMPAPLVAPSIVPASRRATTPADVAVNMSAGMPTVHMASVRDHASPDTITDASLHSPDEAVTPPWHDEPADTSMSDLPTLYAASARLEALLALTRDPRVESGPGAALASEYDAYVSSIDAVLASAELPTERRTQLWQARVGALRAAADLETQRRLLAAQGLRYDGALVRVD